MTMKLIKGNLTITGRIMFVVAALCLLSSLFLPWWYLDLVAPQYPEGLGIEVYAGKVEGRIDIINNLNHYIGMKRITADDFKEFKVIPYVTGVMILLALTTAVVKRRWLAWTTGLMAGSGGLLGIYQLWYWLRDYGTNLDPTAAIKIEPFIPPIMGTNQLANFVTYTGFSVGGYILGLGIILMLVSAWRFSE